MARRYGAVREALAEWISTQEPGTEFNYGDVAEELGLLRPSVSSAFLAWLRAGIVVAPGHAGGWYRVLPQGEVLPAVSRAPLRDLRVNGAREKINELLALQNAPPPDPDVLEVIGRTKDGQLLAKGDNEKYYRVAEI